MNDLLLKLYKNYFTLFTRRKHKKYSRIYQTFKDFTMVNPRYYIKNLMLVDMHKQLKGHVVECGTWRGGMAAGIGTILGDQNRHYYLFDSFEGLPEAKAIDGQAAINWQNDKESKLYYDNCKAEMKFAQDAMQLAGIQNASIIKGWFADTLPQFDKSTPIAFLRLDGDWYDSTMECLDNLYDSVITGGIIIIDDYYTWDGCGKAVHDFMSKRKLSDKIRQWDNDICYFIKESQ